MSNRRLLRKDTSVYLIGNYSPQIVGSKLPSIKQVLSVLFFNLREVKLSVRESSKLVIEEVTIFWNKARIPTRDVQHCIKKVEVLYQTWAGLQKNWKRRTKSQLRKEENFVHEFDNLFDIAHQNALQYMNITEDKEFLINQRKKGREGYMYGIDTELAAREKRKEKRENSYALLKKRSQEETELLGKKKRIENVVEETKTEPPTKKLKRNEPAEKLEKEKPKVYEEEGETEVKKSSSSKKKTKNVDTPVPKPKSYESLGKGPPPFPSTGKKYVGCHVSGAGGVYNCFENGKLSNASSIALFLRNQRSWNAKPLDEETITKWNEMIGDFPPHLILPHGSYLMNLGCPKEETLQKSRKLFVEELQRCEKLGIPHFNFHPGSTLGVISREECCKLIAESINLGHKETSSVICVIENMSCQGFTVGGDFHEIRLIIEGVQDKSRVGVCLDTCHAHAAGYDLSSEKGFHNMVTDFEKIIGWQFLRGLHLNDSKGKAGDHKDRHEVIGKGYIGKKGFERVMNYPKFNDMPLILETPFVSEDQYAKEIKLLQSLIE